MSQELLQALEALEEEKGISKEIVLDALETALVSAYKKNYGSSQNVQVKFDESTGQITVNQFKEVVEEVFDPQLEIALSEARERNRAYEIGDKIRFEVTPESFGRIAAQTAKQVIMQRVREEERSIIYNEYIEYQDDLMVGTVERSDNRFVYVNLGKVEAVLSKRDQIENEVYQAHDRIKVYVSNVEDSAKGPQVFVSRTHPHLIKRLFEQEVPEIYNGEVEIISIAREAGDRSKVAVYAEDQNIDPVGTCVGPKGARVQAVVNELNGENMDIVEYSEDPAEFIKNALNPAEVVDVIFDGEERACTVIVPNYQLSLAIGKRGQNVRLAAKLTNYKIDIKSEDDIVEEAGPVEDEPAIDNLGVDTDFFDSLDDTAEPSSSGDINIDETSEEVAVQEMDLGETDEEIIEEVTTEEELVDIENEGLSEVRVEADEQISDVSYEMGEGIPEDAEDLEEWAEERSDMVDLEEDERL